MVAAAEVSTPRSSARAIRSRVLLINAFVLGVVTMAFEMLASRYLSPYFGSGLAAWGALIAVVLFALASGYYVGGYVADRSPTPRVLQMALGGAGLYLIAIPFMYDPIALALVSAGQDGPGGALMASALLTLVPLFLVGLFPPYAIRWLLSSVDESGRISGGVYALSTMGNIIGTAGTAFFLIPAFGSRALTLVIGAIIVLCSLSLFAIPRK
jgi:MFS family permease